MLPFDRSSHRQFAVPITIGSTGRDRATSPAGAGSSGSTSSSNSGNHDTVSARSASSAQHIDARLTIAGAVNAAELKDGPFVHRRQRLKNALGRAAGLSRSPSDRKLLSRLYFQVAEHCDLSPHARLAMYSDAAKEASLGGSLAVAAHAHRAIVEFAAASESGVEIPRESLTKAIEFAYRAGDAPDARPHLRKTLRQISERYGPGHAVVSAVDSALKLDVALDSQPAHVIETLLSEPFPPAALTRAVSTILSSSPLKPSAPTFVPRRALHQSTANVHFQNSAKIEEQHQAKIQSLPSDDDFFAAIQAFQI